MIVSVLAVLLGVGLLPRSAKAIPPAGIRWWILLGGGGGGGGGQTLGMPRTYFTDPSAAGALQQLGFTQSPADIGVRTYTTGSNGVRSGQQIAITSLVWLDESNPTPYVLNGTIWFEQQIPLDSSLQMWSARASSFPAHLPSSFGNPVLTPSALNPTSYMLKGTSLTGQAPLPTMVLTAVYTVPVVSTATTYHTCARFYYSATDPNPTPPDCINADLTVNPQDQKVEVDGGTVAVDRLSSANKLTLTGGSIQTLITADDVRSCEWMLPDLQNSSCADPNKPTTIKTYNRLTATRAAAWATLTRTMSKLAQERGTFTSLPNGAQLTAVIKDFLEKPVDIWKSSRGEVLFVTTVTDVEINPTDAIVLKGKKIVVFTNASTVTWKKNIMLPAGVSDNSPFYKFATMTFSPGSTMKLTADTYHGAFISKGVVALAGGISPTLTPLTLNGLVIADEIAVTRAVDPAQRVIARITYDPSFQNGTVVGLSPFVVPLVSEGADR